MVDKLTNRSGAFLRPEAFDPARRSLRYKTFLASSKVIGEEVTAALQAIERTTREALQAITPSGWLSLGVPSVTGDGLVLGSQPNTYALDSGIAATTMQAVVNGWLLNIGGASTSGGDPLAYGNNNDRYSTIVLPAAPATGTREDLVFLEAWSAEIDDADLYKPWGCAQYLGDNLTNDIVNSSYSSTLYNKDVVVRWAIRVVSGIDFATYPMGLGAPSAYGIADGAGGVYTFTNMGTTLGDGGLWRAGDGSDGARTALGSTDGYSYAIPMQRIHRRSQEAWSVTTPNGAGIALGGSSDRPDGLFYDEVDARDVEDQRMSISLSGWDYDGIATDLVDKIWAQEADRQIAISGQDTDVAGRTLVYQEAISTGAITGVDITRLTPDAIRRVWSDYTKTQETAAFLTNGSDDADLGGAITFTNSSKTVTLIAPGTPSGTVIAATTPVMKWLTTGLTVAITGSWADLGTATASVVIDSGDGNYQASGAFYVDFDVTFPANQGITKVPTAVNRVDIAGSTLFYLDTAIANLTLANITSNGQYGIAIDKASRSILEIVKREQLTADAGGIATANGHVLDASAGSITGPMITGLGALASVNVIRTYTPETSDQIRLFYEYASYQTEDGLPATLDIDVLWLDDYIYFSNLGTGEGTAGQPYTYPLYHIPENSAITRDSQLANSVDLDPIQLTTNTGFMRLPMLFRDAFQALDQLSAVVVDSEGREGYTDSDVDMVCSTSALQTSQYHRTMIRAVARVTTAAGDFLKNELVVLIFSNTANSTANDAGVAGSSTHMVGVYKLNALAK